MFDIDEAVAFEQLRLWRNHYVKALKRGRKKDIIYAKKGLHHWYEKLGWEKVRPFPDYLGAIREELVKGV